MTLNRWIILGCAVLILGTIIFRAGDSDGGPTCGELRDPQVLSELVDDIDRAAFPKGSDQAQDTDPAQRRRLKAEQRTALVRACRGRDPGERPDRSVLDDSPGP